jgi:hypothetical protein
METNVELLSSGGDKHKTKYKNESNDKTFREYPNRHLRQ